MNMNTFEVLYTHQKQKKNKTWQDGFLKVSCNGTKANLCDNTGTTLETFHIRANKVFVGSDVETDRYLISIEKAQNNNIDTEMKNIQSAFTQNNATSSNCEKQSVMMRRKPDLYASCKPDLPNPDNFPQVTSNQERTSNTTPSNPTWRPRPNCDDNGNLLERKNIPFFHQKNHSLTTNNTRCSIKTTNNDTMLSMVTNNSTITSLNTGSYRTSSLPSNHQHTIESLSQPYCIAPSSWDHHNIGQHPTMMKEKPPVKRNKTQLLSIFFNKTKKLKSDEKESSHKTTFEISSSSGTTAQARVTNDSETTTQARVTNNSETATQAHVTNGSGTGNWNDRNDSNKSPAINHQNENLSNKKNKMQGSLQTSKLSSLNNDNLFDSFDYGMEDNDTHEFLHDIELLENTKHGDTEIIVVSDEEDSVPYTTDTMIPECSSGTNNVSVRDTKVSSSKVPDIREIPCRTQDTKNTPCSTSLNNGKVPYRTEDSRELWLRQPYTIETPYSTSPDTRDTLPFLAPNSLEVPCRLENYRKVPCSTWSDIRISPYQTPTTREVPCSRTPTTHDDILPYQIRTTTELSCRTQDMREVPGRSPENSKIPACLPPNVRELPCASAQPQSTHWTDVVNPTTRHSRNTIVRNTANKV